MIFVKFYAIIHIMIVSFFGHSNTYLNEIEANNLNNLLKQILTENKNCKFYLGGYGNFVNTCLKLLTKLKTDFKNFDIVFVSPYINSNYYKL